MNNSGLHRQRHINLPIFIPELACPRRCIYCNQSRITGQTASPSPDEAAALISRYLESVPAGAEIEIAFFGGSFTALIPAMQKAFLEAAEPFLRRGQASGIRVSTRPDYVDAASLENLKKRGVVTVELGVQSFADSVLDGCQRGYSRQTAQQACHLVKSSGLKLGVQLMIGLPGDSLEACLESAYQAVACGADMVRIYPAMVLEDTELADMAREGTYRPLGLEEAVATAARMLLFFEQNNVEVIRIGLQAATDLQPGQSIVAGPYHPAFGELVEQHIYYQLACQALEGRLDDGRSRTATLLVPLGHRSKMIGQHRANISALISRFGLEGLEVRESLERGRVRRVELITDS